jgi:hypothetical protein
MTPPRTQKPRRSERQELAEMVSNIVALLSDGEMDYVSILVEAVDIMALCDRELMIREANPADNQVVRMRKSLHLSDRDREWLNEMRGTNLERLKAQFIVEAR